MQIIADLERWFAELEPEFAFLLALPFVVAAAAFLGHCFESWNERRRRHAAARQDTSRRPLHPG